MLTKKRFSVLDMVLWTRWENTIFFIYSLGLTCLYVLCEMTFLHLPWTPIALIGTALAFMVGFQNNSAYGRIWEARKIWGGIVNASRTWGMKVQDMVTSQHAKREVPEEEIKGEIKTLVYRHIAWLTALRHAMRKGKPWEGFMEECTNREWSNMIHIPEREVSLEKDLVPYLSSEEIEYVMDKSNKAAAVLYLQSRHLRQLEEKKLIWEFSFLELENLLQELFTLQGKSERIKNFPYPRQYATLGFYFVRIFLVLLPFGIIPEFSKVEMHLAENFEFLSQYFVWLSIPFSVVISWVFHTMERIGRAGENPFEGTANDVPISTISRGIEIDLRELMGEAKETIPKQFPELHNVQM